MLTETAALIPLNTFIQVLTAISDREALPPTADRDWIRFKDLVVSFATAHGVETWADVFNWRIMPALEPEAKRWLLVTKCSQGIKSVQILD
jgi:hypothetical protein